MKKEITEEYRKTEFREQPLPVGLWENIHGRKNLDEPPLPPRFSPTMAERQISLEIMWL